MSDPNHPPRQLYLHRNQSRLNHLDADGASSDGYELGCGRANASGSDASARGGRVSAEKVMMWEGVMKTEVRR